MLSQVLEVHESASAEQIVGRSAHADKETVTIVGTAELGDHSGPREAGLRFYHKALTLWAQLKRGLRAKAHLVWVVDRQRLRAGTGVRLCLSVRDGDQVIRLVGGWRRAATLIMEQWHGV